MTAVLLVMRAKDQLFDEFHFDFRQQCFRQICSLPHFPLERKDIPQVRIDERDGTI
jgi:hypothetical protein